MATFKQQVVAALAFSGSRVDAALIRQLKATGHRALPAQRGFPATGRRRLDSRDQATRFRRLLTT
jgi:hypothetical protein